MIKRFLAVSILVFGIGFPILTCTIEDNDIKENEVVEFIYEPMLDLIEAYIVDNEVNIYTQKSNELFDRQEKLSSIDDKKEWFIAYKNLLEEYSEWCDSPETVYDFFSEDEIYLMQRCIETEVYDMDFESKCNVASVILNRLKSDNFPDKIEEIIVNGQFAFGRENITEDTILALEYAFQIEDTASGALFFHSNEKTESFCRASYIFTDDAGHHFYKQ